MIAAAIAIASFAVCATAACFAFGCVVLVLQGICMAISAIVEALSS